VPCNRLTVSIAFRLFVPCHRLKTGKRHVLACCGLHCLSAFCPLSPIPVYVGTYGQVSLHCLSAFCPLSPSHHFDLITIRQNCLHCLSAFCPLSPTNEKPRTRNNAQSLHCLSAFCPLSPLEWSDAVNPAPTVSPLPFGFLSPVTIRLLLQARGIRLLSPLPFGFLSPVTGQRIEPALR